jgi:hypothetical protein
MLLSGCALPALPSLASLNPARAGVPRPGSTRAGSPGRILVLAVPPPVENRGITDRAAELMAQGLRTGGDVWTADDLLREATLVGAHGWASGAVSRLASGVLPTAEDRIDLLRFSLTGLVVIDVTAYEQVWGKYAKFTRVAVEARGFDVVAGMGLWRLHRAVELEDMRGRAFDHAIESAVGSLVATIAPGAPIAPMDLWRAWRR